MDEFLILLPATDNATCFYYAVSQMFAICVAGSWRWGNFACVSQLSWQNVAEQIFILQKKKKTNLYV